MNKLKEQQIFPTNYNDIEDETISSFLKVLIFALMQLWREIVLKVNPVLTDSPTFVAVTFPATAVPSADPNTLDDYEEGTWTPSLGGTATYTKQVGRYTKLGNSVFVTCNLIVNAIGTGSATTISGLPFTSNATYEYPGSMAYYVSLAISVYSIGPSTASSATTVLFHGQTALDGSSNNNLAIFQNSASVCFNLAYSI